MPDPKSRARVQRLLRGDFRPDDLTGLFLYARDHCDGREPVAEIGHFVAHHQERDRGIVTKSTGEWSAAIRFHASRLDPITGKPNVFHTRKMPVATRDYFEIAVNRIDPRTIRQMTGLSRKAADEAMGGLCNKLKQNADGTMGFAKRSDPNRTQFGEMCRFGSGGASGVYCWGLG
jgi:hypothetical protein